MRIKPSKQAKAAFNSPNSLPIFGGETDSDLSLVSNASQQTTSSSDLGYSYQLPSNFTSGSSHARSLLAGSYNFTPDEIEVFYERSKYKG